MSLEQTPELPESLRARAERAAADLAAAEARELSAAETRRLVHELRVHQIELDMQNEELRSAQKEIERVRDRYFALYDLAPVGYLTSNRGGIIAEANLTAAEMLGLKRAELVREPWSRFVAPADHATYYRTYKRLFEQGAAAAFELRMVRADGAPFDAHVQSVLVPDGSGEMQCWSTIVDISERKRQQRELRAYSEHMHELAEERARQLAALRADEDRRERMAMLGQFAAGVGHDLRNPLSVIANAVYYLLLVCADADPTVREYLQIIEAETLSAKGIITDLLSLVGSRPSMAEACAAAGLVDSALRMQPPPEGVRVVTQFPPSLPLLRVDEQQIERVLANLLSNAYEAMPQGGTVTLSAAARDAEVAISVADTGTGIEPAHLERIFEPLFTTKPAGIGLGLVVVQTLTESNHGRIELESQVGQGTTFTLYLPTAAGVQRQGDGSL